MFCGISLNESDTEYGKESENLSLVRTAGSEILVIKKYEEPQTVHFSIDIKKTRKIVSSQICS